MLLNSTEREDDFVLKVDTDFPIYFVITVGLPRTEFQLLPFSLTGTSHSSKRLRKYS
jgi:hypothetical protein